MAVPGVLALCRRTLAPATPSLVVRALGLEFPGPLGLAAGFDKNALAPDALGALGFGFVEIGTVTAHAQTGNPKPRLFRLPKDRALINRLGFNNRGAAAAAARLARRHGGATIVGVNIGKTKVVPDSEASNDYAESARVLAPYADYCVVNVSSPNTPGLRSLQQASALRPILSRVRDSLDKSSPARRVPLLVKVAPDLANDDVDEVTELALELGLDGIVATNTTIRRAPLSSPREAIDSAGAGGLSGPPVRERAIEVLARIAEKAERRLVIIATGGIETAADALLRLDTGATLLQAYTAFVYEGPLFAAHLHRDLAHLLRARGDTCADLTSVTSTGPLLAKPRRKG